MSFKKFISGVDSEAGFGIVEILVGLVLISVVAIGVTLSLIMSLTTFKLAEKNLAATNLAGTKLEMLAATNTANLSNTYDTVEMNVTDPATGIVLTRVTDITVNADSTVTILVKMYQDYVSVSNPGELVDSYTTVVAVWGG